MNFSEAELHALRAVTQALRVDVVLIGAAALREFGFCRWRSTFDLDTGETGAIKFGGALRVLWFRKFCEHTLPPIIGVEWDGRVDNGLTPNGFEMNHDALESRAVTDGFVGTGAASYATRTELVRSSFPDVQRSC